MLRQILPLVATVILSGATVKAGEKSIDEYIQRIRTGSTPSYAVDRLLDLQEKGIDISAAHSVLRSYLRQQVSTRDVIGVEKFGEGALLCLMRMGDADAQDHFLIAQKRHLDQYLFSKVKTGSCPIDDLYEYYAALDQDHRAGGFELHRRAYEYFQPFLFREKPDTSKKAQFLRGDVLAGMVRLAPDPKTQIRLLNENYCFLDDGYHMFDGSGHWIRDLIYQLTSDQDLFPQLPKDNPEKFEGMSKDYTAMICFMAPYRTEVRERFSVWMSPKQKYHREFLVARFIDSASRMEPQKRKEAHAYLRKSGADWYQQKQHLLERLEYKPHYMNDTAQVLQTIRRVFGDTYLPTEQAKEVLKIETGLGTGF